MREPALRVVSGSGDNDVAAVEERGGTDHLHAHWMERGFRVEFFLRRFVANREVGTAGVCGDFEGIVVAVKEKLVIHKITS